MQSERFVKIKSFWEEKARGQENNIISKNVQIDTCNTVHCTIRPKCTHLDRQTADKTLETAINTKCRRRQEESVNTFLAGVGVVGFCFVVIKMLMPHTVIIG